MPLICHFIVDKGVLFVIPNPKCLNGQQFMALPAHELKHHLCTKDDTLIKGTVNITAAAIRNMSHANGNWEEAAVVPV